MKANQSEAKSSGIILEVVSWRRHRPHRLRFPSQQSVAQEAGYDDSFRWHEGQRQKGWNLVFCFTLQFELAAILEWVNTFFAFPVYIVDRREN